MIIDFHTHIFPSFFRNERQVFFREEPAFEILYRPPESRLVGRKALLESMDRDGIQKSVIFGFPWKKAEHFRRHNDYIIESVQEHPDRLIGFCCFDPLSPESTKETERCLDAGLLGIGELAFYDSVFSSETIKAFGDIMQMASRYGVPLLLHANEPVGHDYPGKIPMTLGQIYDFVRAFPENRIVLAHWGGGLFFYNIMKKEVGEVLKNVWFDTAASPFLYKPDIYKTACEIIGVEKILFGSDYPLISPSRYFKEMSFAKLPSEDMSEIQGKNAARLLNMST